MNLATPPFTLRQLQYAVAVAEALNFRKAAAQCAVSQPSLSAQLAELEGALGVRLFERDRSGVVVTPAGRTLVARARAVLDEARALTRDAQQAGDVLAGTLRLGVIPTVAPYLLPQVMPALRKAFPRLTTLWREERTAPLSVALASGALEAVVVALEANLGEVDHAVLAVDPFVLAVPRGSPLDHAGAVSLRELKQSEVLVLEDGHCFGDQAIAYCEKKGVAQLEFRATSLGTLAQMVGAGAGVTLLPALSVPTEAKRAAVRVRTFEKPVPHRTLALAWRKGSPLGPALEKLAAVMRAHTAVTVTS